MSDDLLRDRLILAALNTLTDGDPLLIIGVADNEIRLGWVDLTDKAQMMMTDIAAGEMSDNGGLSEIASDTNRRQVNASVDLRDRIAAVLDKSLNRQLRIDRPDRFKDWIDNRELADAVTDLLIDMAGHGELLKAIDRMHRD